MLPFAPSAPGPLRLFNAAILSPVRSPSAPSVDKPENDQKKHGADRCGNDGGNYAGAEVDTQLGQQPTSNQGADDSNTNVGDQAVSSASHDLSGKPSGDQTDE